MPPQIPNVPSFEQIGYNGRLKKTIPEVAKDYSTMNGMPSGPSSAPASNGPQVNPFDRPGITGPNMFGQPQMQVPSGLNQQGQQQQYQQQPQTSQQSYQGESKDRQEPEQPMSDDAGDWKERFRLSQESSEQTRDHLNNSISGANAWERRARDDDGKEEDEEEEEEEDAGVLGEGESTKVWKAKRTLRKSVS